MVASVLPLPTARDVAARTDLFQSAAAVTMIVAAARPTESDPAERGLYLAVSGDYFSMLGVPAAIGRTLTPEDDHQRERVIVLGHRMWSTRFASDPTVVGKTIRLNTVEFVVVGVAPATFRGTEPMFEVVGYVPSSVIGVLVPGLAGLEESRGIEAGRFTVLARRQPARSVAEIGSALGVLSQQIEAAYPEVGEQFRLAAFPEVRARPTLPAAGWMLPVASVFATLALLVLLTASVNATNLILARGSSRATELAVRQALGASRARLVSQLLTETLLLAFLALAGGWVLAKLAVGALTSMPLAVDGLPLSWGMPRASRKSLSRESTTSAFFRS
jgi:ABC-type antimicrobial peptide transport system permease subunit